MVSFSHSLQKKQAAKPYSISLNGTEKVSCNVVLSFLYTSVGIIIQAIVSIFT
jgi:hypothetical protein